jgi:hypothetical protein
MCGSSWTSSACTTSGQAPVQAIAGLDTRAFHLLWPIGANLFEIELFNVMDFKRRVLTETSAQSLPAHSHRHQLRGQGTASISNDVARGSCSPAPRLPAVAPCDDVLAPDESPASTRWALVRRRRPRLSRVQVLTGAGRTSLESPLCDTSGLLTGARRRAQGGVAPAASADGQISDRPRSSLVRPSLGYANIWARIRKPGSTREPGGMPIYYVKSGRAQRGSHTS